MFRVVHSNRSLPPAVLSTVAAVCLLGLFAGAGCHHESDQEEPPNPPSSAGIAAPAAGAAIPAPPGISARTGDQPYEPTPEPTPTPDGLPVVSVVANSPAWAAGLQKDDLLKRVDGTPIHRGLELRAKMASEPAGDVHVELERDGKPMTALVHFGGSGTVFGVEVRP